MSWLFQHARDGLLLVDGTSCRVTRANPAARALFGWRRGQEAQRELEALVAEPWRAEVRAVVEARLARRPRASRPLEVTILGPGGEHIPAELALDRLPRRTGERVGLLVSVRDLRERAQSTARREALLRVARLAAHSDVGQLFEALLAEAVAVLHADDGGIARWDAERRVLWQAYTFLPSTSAGAELDLETSASGRAASQRTATIVNDYQRAIGAATPAGRLGAQAVVAAPLVYAGRLLGTLSVSRLRTGQPFVLADAELLELLASTASATLVNLERQQQLRATVEQLQHAKEAAEAADRAKTTFLASMSHELRTPLNAIIGYSEMLQEEAPHGLVADLEKIQHAGRELLSLIDSVLELSEIESGALRLRWQRLAVDPLVDEVVAAARPLVEQHGHTLTLDRGAELGEMWADPACLRQALLSLLGDASKYGQQAALRLEVSREQRACQAWLNVRLADTGLRLTPEREKLDAGLGLALSRRLCALMGGTLETDSQPGAGGTVFTLSLPTERPAQEPYS